MGMILRIASSRIVGQGDIVGRSGYFSLNLSANSVMRGRLDARRTLKSLVADLRIIFVYSILSQTECYNSIRIFRTTIQFFYSGTLQYSFHPISGWSYGNCLILTSYSIKCCYRLRYISLHRADGNIKSYLYHDGRY